RTETEARRRRDRVYALADDPRLKLVPPKAQEPVPFLNFAPLQNAVARLQKAAAALEEQAPPATPAARASRNEALFRLERKLTRPEGLPGRPWFVHQIYAPGFYTGYGVKTLPGIREALEQRRFSEVPAQVEKVAATLDAYSTELERMATSQ